MCGCVLWSGDPAFSCNARDPWTPCEQPGILRLLVAGVADRARPKSRNGAPAKKPSRSDTREAIERELSPTASMTDLGGHVGRSRRVAFAQAPLEDCKQAGKAIDSSVTLNDVALAIVAGGARRWLMHVNGPMDGIRVKVPVSLHHSGDDAANHDSCFFVDLPVAETDPTARVLAINRETTERKLDHDAETLYRLGTHPLIARHAMSPRVFTFNVSNVRGPEGDLYIRGARVRAMYSLAEIAQHHALRVSVVSAVGSLFFGFCADADAMKDLDVLADGIRASIDELLALRA
jgi:WS/DGAT/MGAT family acyltransferase